MQVNEEEINSKTFYMLDNKNIKEIIIRKVGLLDVFGKIMIDIKFNNNSEKHLVGISPVDTGEVKRWLEKNKLYEKAKLYEY